MRHPALVIPLVLGCIGGLASVLRGEPAAGPRPVAAWPTGPLEVRVAFDGPVPESALKGLQGGSIPFGEPDPKDPTRLASTAGKLGIAAARLIDGGRTIVLATDPHPREATYVVSIPGSGVIAYRLGGVEASWSEGTDEAAKPAWTGWWPAVDPETVRERLKGSAEHERGFPFLSRPGKLILRGLLALPAGKARVRFEATGPIVVVAAGATPAEGNAAVLAFDSTGEAVDLAVVLSTGTSKQPATLVASYRIGDEGPFRPLPPESLILPWAPAPPSAPPASDQAIPDLSGGDPVKGEAVFRAAESKCTTCHKMAGQGGEVGPPLDSIAGRDRAWIYRAIALPSVEIHPEYVPYTVALKDGRIAAGIVRGSGLDAIRVLDAEGKPTVVPKLEIEELRPSGTSIMPVGLEGAIGPEKMRDLVAYLAAPKPIGPKK